MSFVLRDVTIADAAAIAGIYRHYVETSIATFEEAAPDAREMQSRIAAIQAGGFPWLVAEKEGRVVAYAYAGLFKTRSAYRFTVENSVYVAKDQHRGGLATGLMREIIARCTVQGYRQMIAGIAMTASDAVNPSVQMHASLGFQPAGRLCAVGMKFGKWIDVVEMQLALGEGDKTIPR